MSKKILTLTTLALGLAGYFLLKPHDKNVTSSSDVQGDKNLPIVAITQIIEHPALDAEKAGIIQALKAAGFEDGKQIKVVFQNAQGNIATATQIAKQLVSLKPKAVVAISTPSAQAVLTESKKEKIPLIFSAVSDPIEAKLVTGFSSTKDATGVSDYLPPKSQLELVRIFHPKLKRLGFIYNPGEINSVQQLQKIRDMAKSMGIEIIESTISKTSDASAAVNNLVGKAEAIYVPNDNTGVAAMKSIVQTAEKSKLPVYAGDTGSVEVGAIATNGYDRSMLGQKAGNMLVKVLKGKSIVQMPVERDHDLQVYINFVSAERFGVVIPEKLKKKAKMVGVPS
jgi:putative ABC transport system substrate-binding protein